MASDSAKSHWWNDPAKRAAGIAGVAALPVVLVNSVAFIGQFAYLNANVPWPVPARILIAVTVESIAVYLAWHAHLARMANDSAMRLALGAYTVALIIGTVNYSHFAHELAADPAGRHHGPRVGHLPAAVGRAHQARQPRQADGARPGRGARGPARRHAVDMAPVPLGACHCPGLPGTARTTRRPCWRTSRRGTARLTRPPRHASPCQPNCSRPCQQSSPCQRSKRQSCQLRRPDRCTRLPARS